MRIFGVMGIYLGVYMNMTDRNGVQAFSFPIVLCQDLAVSFTYSELQSNALN
jgi:hypothetical protein